MMHEEILGKAEAYRAGTLDRTESAEMGEHLASCPTCREIVAKWPVASPREGFTQRVMANLEKAPSAPAWRPVLAPMAGLLVSMALVLVAFWHPEKDWIRADKGFASFESGNSSVGFLRHLKESHHE